VVPHTYDDFDFWQEPGAVGRPVDIRVSQDYFGDLVAYLDVNSLEHSVHIADVQTHFEEARVGSKDGQWDTEYHSFADIQNWLKAAALANPSFVKLITLGLTYQNRTVYGLTISRAPANAPQVYFDGGIHAREWIAPAVVQYLIGQFVNHSGSGSKPAQYLSQIEFTMVPVWNADGYAYTWETDPNWRKNRQPNTGTTCIGTDICRNFPAGWGMSGSSASPCADDYHGTAAWSSPEAVILRQYASQYLPRLAGYINFHSYAELWLTNYGYTATRPKDYNIQEATAKNVTDAIKAVHGQQYGYGPAYTTIYPAACIPSDWTYDNLGVVFSTACELRGNSFQPAPSLIVPNGEEIAAGVYALCDSILANHNTQNN
jgi:plastocyanin